MEIGFSGGGLMNDSRISRIFRYSKFVRDIGGLLKAHKTVSHELTITHSP